MGDLLLSEIWTNPVFRRTVFLTHNCNLFQRKLEGTKVTLESFLAWKAKFDIEFFKAKAVRDPSKPTGREMFINNAALNESDIEFLTNGNFQSYCCVISNNKIIKISFQHFLHSRKKRISLKS